MAVTININSRLQDAALRSADAQMMKLGRTAIASNASMAGAFLRTGASLQRLGSQLTAVGRAGTMFISLPIAAGLFYAAKAAMAEQKALGVLELQTRRNTGATAAQAAAVDSFIKKQSLATGITVSDLIPAMARLEVATKSRTKAEELLKVAEDVSAGTGKDLGTVAIALSRAYLGVNTSLGRLGVQTSVMVPTQVRVTAAMALASKGALKAGQSTEILRKKSLSFDQILPHLIKSYGGDAAQAANSTAGRFARLGASVHELAVETGDVLLPFIDSATADMTKLDGWLQKLDPHTRAVAVDLGLIAAAGFPALTVIGKMTNGIGRLSSLFGVAGLRLGLLGTSKGAGVGGVVRGASATGVGSTAAGAGGATILGDALSPSIAALAQIAIPVAVVVAGAIGAHVVSKTLSKDAAAHPGTTKSEVEKLTTWWPSGKGTEHVLGQIYGTANKISGTILHWWPDGTPPVKKTSPTGTSGAGATSLIPGGGGPFGGAFGATASASSAIQKQIATVTGNLVGAKPAAMGPIFAQLALLHKVAKEPILLGNVNAKHTPLQLLQIRNSLEKNLHMTVNQADTVMSMMFRDWNPAKDLSPKVMRAEALLRAQQKVFRRLGLNMTDGLGAGVVAGSPSAVAKVRSLAVGMSTQFATQIDAQSPSKVFYQHGLNIDAGIEQGITGGAGGPLGAMATLGRQLVAKLSGFEAKMQRVNSGASFANLSGGSGGGGGAGGSGGGSSAGRVALIRQYAQRYGVDPRAALAVASMEGLGGGIGDNGTSFGPFQLHIGGAFPSSITGTPAQKEAWANSASGINYAMSAMKSDIGRVAFGYDSVAAIVSRFERPANPSAEIAGAWARYKSYDQGGWLPVGLSLALNNTGAPEPVGNAFPGIMNQTAARAGTAVNGAGGSPVWNGDMNISVDHLPETDQEALAAMKRMQWAAHVLQRQGGALSPV